MIRRNLCIAFLGCITFSNPALADRRVAESDRATSDESINDLSTRDTKLEARVGKEFFPGTILKSLTYRGTVDVQKLEDKEIGVSIRLNDVDHVSEIRSGIYIADFQHQSTRINDSIEVTVIPRQEDIGKVYAIIFNVNSFGKFDYAKKMKVGDGPTMPHGASRGTGTSVGHTPTSFRIKSTEPVTITFAPETNDRWWFHSCDFYILEYEKK